MENVEVEQKDSLIQNIKEHKYSNPFLKFKKIIIKENNSATGLNDIFEIFQSFKNGEIYLASPNKNEYNIDIISIENCKLITSLKGHNNYINIVKYFINEKNKKEFLVTVDKGNIIIIWDISNNYSNFCQIKDESRGGFISSTLLIFNIEDLFNQINNYIIYSFNNALYTKIYSLDGKQKIRNLENINKDKTYYLMHWFNKKDNNNYLIELGTSNVYIYDLVKENPNYNIRSRKYKDSKINCGFIYNKNNHDFLIASSENYGNIMIFDLENKIEFNNNISLYKRINKSKIYISYILQWSEKYMIVCEYFNRGFKIIDIDTFKIITSINDGKHLGAIICGKKFFHPILGECLLSAGQDNNIILWGK